MNNKTLQTIKAIRELYSDSSKWTRGAFAKDTSGKSVGSRDPEACCWCILGAICKCSDDSESLYLTSKLIDEYIPQPYITAEFNDKMGYEAVCNLLDRIIEKYS